MGINIKRMWLNKQKLAKNTSIYQNLIVFSWAFVSFSKNKNKNSLKSSLIFILSVWLILHKIAIKKNLQLILHKIAVKKTYEETYILWVLKKKKKEADFINNQLECFSFSFSLVLKQNTFMTFPNQNLKHPKT